MISRRALLAGLASLWTGVASAFWQSRDSNYNVSIGGVVAPAITLVGTATGTTTATVPTHLAGDLIIICAYRSNTTAASLPSGYSSILTKSGTTASIRVGYKIATTTNDSSGTWTNALALVCHVYRPSSGNTMGIGTSASAAQTTNTINYPALTLADGFSGNSWIAGFCGVSNTTNTIAVAPSGMTNESHETAAAAQCAGHDTEGGVSSWSSTNATTTGTAGDSVSCTVELMLLPVSPQPPHVVQHIGGGTYPPSVGSPMVTGNGFLLPIMNPTLTGNCLVLGITYPNGQTVTVSDNINGAWPAASVHANAGAGNADSAIYVFPNIAAGQTTVTVTFSTGVNLFQYSLTEFYNIDATPAAGTASAAFTAGPAVSTGNFTPTNNNSTGGNMIWVYCAESSTTPSTLTQNMRAGQNLTLLDSDIGWVNADGLFHSSACYIQATSAAFNPTITNIGDTDKFNICAVALKLNSSQGTVPGSNLRLVRICHFTSDHYPATGSYNLSCPVVGNLRIIASDDPGLNAQTITDSEGGTYTITASGSGMWYRANTTSNSNLQIICTGGSADTRLSWRIYDVVNAAASPFDSGGASNQGVNSVSTFTMSPTPTPTSSSGIVIANVGLGQGPGLAITAPAGAVYDLCTYNGTIIFTETSTNNFINNDTIAIGNNTFKFVTVIGVTAGNVLIGANFAASASNLAAAINAGAGSGTLYITPTNTPNVSCIAATTTISFTTIGISLAASAAWTATYTAAGTSAGSFQAVTFIGETDFDYIEDADLSAHYYYASSGAETWTWTITNVASNSTSGGWGAFHS